jgi:hypothetical protein
MGVRNTNSFKRKECHTIAGLKPIPPPICIIFVASSVAAGYAQIIRLQDKIQLSKQPHRYFNSFDCK